MIPAQLIDIFDHLLHWPTDRIAYLLPVKAVVVGSGRLNDRIPKPVEVSFSSHEHHGRASEGCVQGPGETRFGAGPSIAAAAKALGEVDARVTLPAINLIVASGQVVHLMPGSGIAEAADAGQQQIHNVASTQGGE